MRTAPRWMACDIVQPLLVLTAGPWRSIAMAARLFRWE